MKKKLYSSICLWCLAVATLCACGKQGNSIDLSDGEELNSIGNGQETVTLTVVEQAEEDAMWDRIPMVRVNGKLYYDTGKESTVSGRCGNMDGEIATTVDETEIPMEDNQSNFGSGFGYQYGEGNTIEVYMNEKWFVFECKEK